MKARTASLGVEKVGILRCWNSARLWAAACSPTQLVRIGRRAAEAFAITASAAPMLSAIAVGQLITRMPSAFFSSTTACIAAAYRPGGASPMMSIGLA
jgi:hypothetical protein